MRDHLREGRTQGHKMQGQAQVQAQEQAQVQVQVQEEEEMMTPMTKESEGRIRGRKLI